jgi:hypothetical protein
MVKLVTKFLFGLVYYCCMNTWWAATREDDIGLYWWYSTTPILGLFLQLLNAYCTGLWCQCDSMILGCCYPLWAAVMCEWYITANSCFGANPDPAVGARSRAQNKEKAHAQIQCQYFPNQKVILVSSSQMTRNEEWKGVHMFGFPKFKTNKPLEHCMYPLLWD